MSKTVFFGVLAIILFLAAGQPAGVQAQIKLDVGGYLQTWYIADQTTEVNSETTVSTNGFRLRRARLTARGRINENFSATTWLDFAGPDQVLLDFHMDAHIYPWLNIRAGQFIMPGQSFDTGRLVSSRLIFFDRPGVTTTLASGMGYSAFRDIGVMVYGSRGRLWYGIHAGNGAGRFNQAGTQITERKTGGGLYGARVDYEITDGLMLGGHVSTNQQRDVVQSGTGPFDIDRKSWSLRLQTQDLGIERLYSQFEYMRMDVNDDSRGVLTDADGNHSLHGFYVEAGYGITPEWHILGRFDQITQKPGQTGNFRGANRFSRDSITLGLTRYVFHDNQEIARAHLNYQFGDAVPGGLRNHILVLILQLRFIP